MLDLTHHIAARDRLMDPVQLRAIAGAEAAERMADVKAEHFEALPYYQEIERIMFTAGDNLKAILLGDPDAPGFVTQARAKMARLWAEYERAKACEQTIVDLNSEMERAA